MEPAKIPANESKRLASLYSYDIMDSEKEGVFDELTELAANICDTPIALISLIDESRQWFKSRVGLNVNHTARDVAFCAHAILQPDIFIVPDTLEDQRFADNPMVTGPPHIRFYAGAPLFTADGYGLGTICVIDQEPRELSRKQKKTLAVLRTHILKLLELRRLTRELDNSHRELETLSYTLSHDLRAPLRTIMGFSQILLEDHGDVLDSDARNLLDRINDAASRMDKLTVELISLARMSSQPMEFYPTNLSRIAQDVISKLSKSEPTRHVDVHIQPALTAYGDPLLLRVVLENLLDNAWKFTSKTPQPHIEFGAVKKDGKKEFFVRDNGVGFEMAYAGKLFHPFHRLHLETDYPGTGIGLAAVRRIIERHGGTIHAESAINEGTTIHFSLPSSKND